MKCWSCEEFNERVVVQLSFFEFPQRICEYCGEEIERGEEECSSRLNQEKAAEKRQ